MLSTKSASAMSSTRTKPSTSNCSPTARTHSSCAGEVAVPQMAYLRTARVYPPLAEEVPFERHDKVAPAAFAFEPEAADDCCRDAVGLPHYELRRSGDLVRDRDLRGMQLVAARVELAVEIEDRRGPGDSERDIGGSEAPGPAERVGNDDTDIDAGQLADPRPESCSRGVGIDREENQRVRSFRVRGVDAGRGAHEPVPRLRDDEGRARAHDLACFGHADLDAPRVGVTRELACALGYFDAREVDDPALHLRDRLLCDDEDVVLSEPAYCRRRLDDKTCEVAVLLELREAVQRDDAKLARQPSPVTRIPAWPLYRRFTLTITAVRTSSDRAFSRGPASSARPAVSRPASSRAEALASVSSPQTNASSSGGLSAPRLEAASEWSPASTGPSSSAWICSARERELSDGRTPSCEKRSSDATERTGIEPI